MKNNVKIIFHIDMNAFFISCELISNPHLKNKPIAISGKGAKYNKGVIVTASYEARRFGVKSAMPVFEAKKLCPELILITSNMSIYSEYSNKFISFLKQYTPLIEVASIDEAYLDVTELCQKVHPLSLANEIQERLYKELQLPTSIGIAANKFLAKMASDMKKPMGITVLRKREIEKLLWPLDIKEMYGIGKMTYPKLKECGILTIGDLASGLYKEKAMKILGNQYDHFFNCANGHGSTIVDPSKNDQYKSIGNSLTYSDPIKDENIAYFKLKELTEVVSKRLIHHGYVGKTVTVQIKNIHFKTHSKSKTLLNPIFEIEELYNNVITLFDLLWDKEPIRLLGVSVTNIIEKQHFVKQLDLFSYEEEQENEKVIQLMNDIKRKYGEKAITYGYKIKK